VCQAWRRKRRVIEDDLCQLEGLFGATDIGPRELNLPLGGFLQRLIPFDGGIRPFEGRTRLVARFDRAGTFFSSGRRRPTPTMMSDSHDAGARRAMSSL
jgi:hypothetical protein